MIITFELFQSTMAKWAAKQQRISVTLYSRIDPSIIIYNYITIHIKRHSENCRFDENNFWVSRSVNISVCMQWVPLNEHQHRYYTKASMLYPLYYYYNNKIILISLLYIVEHCIAFISNSCDICLWFCRIHWK